MIIHVFVWSVRVTVGVRVNFCSVERDSVRTWDVRIYNKSLAVDSELSGSCCGGMRRPRC